MRPDIIILAAGKGTRMRSDLPKVLHCLAGKPMLSHVIDTARSLQPRAIHIVTGAGSERVHAAYQDQTDLHWVEQAQQLGTGHAVSCAVPELAEEGHSLILYGDVPLISRDSLQGLLAHLDGGASVAVLTLITERPEGLGRIIRDSEGGLHAIVEDRDASADERQINEINTGIMAVRNTELRELLARVNNQNAQSEYYLTDIVALAKQSGLQLRAETTTDDMSVQGVNDRLQLSQLERSYQRSTAKILAKNGTTVMDPDRLDIRGQLNVGTDVIIDANVIIEGSVTIGDRVQIEANVSIKNCVIDSDVRVRSHSYLEGSRIGAGAQIGPFARLREGTVLEPESKIGNFVETKKAHIGRGSKVNHLSYIGDTEMGTNVNVGAGTITCNYDGVNKHQTRIEDEVFIGSNSSLVAPVEIGKAATIGAGSVLTRNVEDGALAVARGKQRNISGWQRPVRKQDS